MTVGLVPDPVEARAQSHSRIPFAFAPRFFVVLLIGLVWLIPSWWSGRFLVGMFAWDLLVVIGWTIDLLRLPSPSRIAIQRRWIDPPMLARASQVELLVSSDAVGVELFLIETAPPTVTQQPPRFHLRPTIPGEAIAVQYPILPASRGMAQFGSVYIRYRSSLGLAERWAVATLSQTATVLPDVVQAQDQALLLIRTRQVDLQKRRQRQRGIGREFESLREYRQGDEMRDICWSATARRSQLITRTYEAERSQAVWLLLDAGRLLRARVEQAESDLMLSKLDYSVNAALSLAEVASQYGDRVGLIAYSRQLQAIQGPGRGGSHLRALVDALANVRAEPNEADHGRAARTLLQKQTRRALVIWITDFAETPSTPDVVEFATHVAQRHLVLFAAVSQPDLARLAGRIPDSESEMFQIAAAQEVMFRRDLLLRRLRECGVLAMELEPKALNSALINEYLQVKERSLL